MSKYYLANENTADVVCDYRVLEIVPLCKESDKFSRAYALSDKNYRYMLQKKIKLFGWRIWISIKKFDSFKEAEEFIKENEIAEPLMRRSTDKLRDILKFRT